MTAPGERATVDQDAMTSNAGMTPGRELAGNVALITGGGRNIGRAIALSLAAGGASVMVNVDRSRGDAEETVRLVEAVGGKAASFIADVTRPDDVAAMVAATVARFGRIDVLVNNAALRTEQTFANMPFADWRRILSVILDGAFLCSQACLPYLAQGGRGAIVNIGGETGHRGAADPGAPAHRPATPPVGRLGTPGEVAAMVRMLCGPDARYVTGQAIHVNGGGWMP